MSIAVHGIVTVVAFLVFACSLSFAAYKEGYQNASEGQALALKEQRRRFAAAVDEYMSLPSTIAILPDGTRASCVHLGRAYQSATNRLHGAAGYEGMGWRMVLDPLPVATPTQGDPQ